VPGKSDRGEELEARVARLLLFEGALTRRRINLEAQFGERFAVVTDIDVIAFWVDQTLRVAIDVGECKSGDAKGQPSSGDRMLWLAGVATLAKADRAFLATARAAGTNARDLARKLGIEVLDERDLERREALAGITPDAGWGSHDPAIRAMADEAFKVVRPDDELRRLYWFVRTELWLGEPVAVVKKALGACRILGTKWSERLSEEVKRSLLWLGGEVIVGLSLALTRIAATAHRQPEETFEGYLRERLAEGLADHRALSEISRNVDRLVMAVVGETGGDPTRATQFLGTFAPQPPLYAEPLTELLQRIARSRSGAADLARVADWTWSQSLLGATMDGGPVFGNYDASIRLLRLVAAFVERQARMPGDLLGWTRDQPSALREAVGGQESSGGAPAGIGPDARASVASTPNGNGRSQVPGEGDMATNERPTLFSDAPADRR
jgi:hypothetical protein